LPETISPYDESVYAQARGNLQLFERQGLLTRRDHPRFFIYRLSTNGHSQTGVAACCTVDEYESALICKHENTRPDKENDRTRHMLALSAHAEPVLIAYRGRQEIDELVEAECQPAPLLDFPADDGVRHTLWLARNETALVQAFAQVPRLYIADGHHRSASAARARAELRVQNPSHTGNEAYNFFPAVLFPAEQLRILAYNRVLRNLPDWHPQEFLEKLRREFEYFPDAPAAPEHKGEISLYFAGQWHGIKLKPPHTQDPVARHDVSRLQAQLLAPYFSIVDQRTDSRIDFAGGAHGIAAMQKMVDTGAAQLALSLFPTSRDELLEVSDAGALMPPKSTWFDPKLRSGLFVHPLE
jgi:uncharacterized protein (DUF1015 family)